MFTYFSTTSKEIFAHFNKKQENIFLLAPKPRTYSDYSRISYKAAGLNPSRLQKWPQMAIIDHV